MNVNRIKVGTKIKLLSKDHTYFDYNSIGIVCRNYEPKCPLWFKPAKLNEAAKRLGEDPQVCISDLSLVKILKY